MNNKHRQNIEIIEHCTTNFLTLLKKNLYHVNKTKYPGIISTNYGTLMLRDTIQIVCPETTDPSWIAISPKDKDMSGNYVSHWLVLYTREIDEMDGKINLFGPKGFCHINQMEYYNSDPSDGWDNPTLRILVESLRPLPNLIKHLKDEEKELYNFLNFV